MLLIIISGVSVQALELEQIQQAILQDGAQWTAAKNPVYGLSQEEKQMLCGALTPKAWKSLPPSASMQQPLPRSFTWTDAARMDFTTPPKDQGNCGSCWAFASTGAVEMLYTIGYEMSPDLSEQHLLSCSGGGDCSSGYISDAFNYYKEQGAPKEECFPYVERRISCDKGCKNWEDEAATIDDWRWITQGESTDQTLLKQAILRGPVTTLMVVHEDFMAYESGVYNHTTGDEVGYHAVVLIGWDDRSEAWQVKNSWGRLWGEEGFFRIRMGDSQIGSWAIAPEMGEVAVPEIDTGSITLRAGPDQTSPPQAGVGLRNAGDNVLYWQAIADADWLSVDNETGKSSGEWDYFTVGLNILEEMAPGKYEASVYVLTPGALQTVTKINVLLHLEDGYENPDTEENEMEGAPQPTFGCGG